MKTKHMIGKTAAWTCWSNRMITTLALTGSLAMSASALAQDYVTGTEYLSNITSNALETSPNELYSGWNPSSGYPDTTINDVTSGSDQGLEIVSLGYGSLYYSIPLSQQVTLNPDDAAVSLTFTINSPSGSYYVGVPFILDDNNDNSDSYLVDGTGYNTYGNGTWTITLPLASAMLTDTEAGDEIITGLNLEFDPAGNLPNGSGPYDITFNSLSFEPVPEPASLALLGIGFVGLMAARRRKS